MELDKSIVHKTLNICLTPRFWKGELVYDGRKPLTIYDKPIYSSDQPTTIDQQKPYPPSWTRSPSPQDGLLYHLGALRNIKGGRGIKMLICITLYNQPIQFLERTLVGVWKNLRKLVHERGLSNKQVAVIIVQDGILKLLKNKITKQFSTVVNFFEKMDFESGRTKCIIKQRIGVILEETINYERRELGDFVRKNNDIPPSIPKNIALLYQNQWRPDQKTNKQFNLNIDYEKDPFLQLFGCFKHVNAKKLSSHLWFFQGFCRYLTPEYCTLIDVGTQAQEYGLINFLNALENNPDCGGVSGFMTLDLNVQSTQSTLTSQVVTFQQQTIKYDLEQCCYPIPILSTIGILFLTIFDKIFACFAATLSVFTFFHQCFSVQRAQLFQYNYSHMLDKNFESCFGYLNVLPGAWSAYRYRAISKGNRYEQNLLEKKYLKIVLDPNFTERDYKEANMYLAEDRILCLGIYCQKDSKYYLKYVPDAEAKTDPMDDLIDLMVQRRRWINSSYFAFDYVWRNYNYDVRDSTHTWKSQSIFMPIIMLMSKANILNTYLTPALFFFALYTSVFQTYQQIVIPVKTAQGTVIPSGWVIVPAFVCLGYVTILTVMIGVCVNKSAKQARNIFIITSSVLGIYYLLLISVVVFYIGINYFMPSGNNYQDPNAQSTRNLIKFLTLINFISLSVPVIMHTITHPGRVLEMIDPRTLISYLYYQAVYSHTLVIYAFCNIDDVTWGTKGIEDAGQKKSYFNDKIQFVSQWIFWNTFLSFMMIFLNGIFQSQTNRSLMLISVGAYSTIIVFLKFAFAFIYHIFEYTSKSWLKKLYYPQKQKQKIQQMFANENAMQQYTKRVLENNKQIKQQKIQPAIITLSKSKQNKKNSGTIIRSNKPYIENVIQQQEKDDEIAQTSRALNLGQFSQIRSSNGSQYGKVIDSQSIQIKTKVYNN